MNKREFLLAVGLEQTLLCMLMQQFSTPSLPIPGHLSPTVDAVYVDRGRALLLELRAQDLLNLDDMGANPLPSLASADSAVSSVFRRTSRQLVTSVSQRTKGRKLSDSFSIGINSVDNGSDSDEEVDGANCRRTQSMLHLKQNFRQRKAQQIATKNISLELASKKIVAGPRPPYT
jgi:hypothetical protein